MFDNGRLLCQLAADTVMSAQAYARAASTRTDIARSGARLAHRVAALAEAFYATEEIYAMEVCFGSVGKAGVACGVYDPLPSGKNGVIYALVASLIASLVSDAERMEDLPDAAFGAGSFQAERLSLLSRTLSEAGYSSDWPTF